MESVDLTFLVSLLRFVSLGVGVVDVVLTSHSFNTERVDETFFFVVILCTTIFSLLLLCGYLSQVLTGTLKVKYIDIAFHMGGGLTLLISGIFMMAAVLDRNFGEDYTVERTISALFGIQNAVIFGIIGLILFKSVPSAPSKYGDGLEWEDPLIETVEAKKADFGSITGNP